MSILKGFFDTLDDCLIESCQKLSTFLLNKTCSAIEIDINESRIDINECEIDINESFSVDSLFSGA